MPISQPPLIEVPFAESGLKNAIPANANNITGNAGFDLGFPPINLTAVAAGGIPPYGQDMNGILYEITQNLQYQQTGTAFVYDAAFATAIGGYPVGSTLIKLDGSGWWINTLVGNTSDPDTGGANWFSVPFSSLGNSLSIASQAEAIAGTDNTKAMSPLRVAQAFPSRLIDNIGFSKVYTSPQQVITSGGGLTLAHGLGQSPKFVTAFLVCINAENGYSVNDEYYLGITQDTSGGTAQPSGFSLTLDATNLFIRYISESSVFRIVNKSNGTNAGAANNNWRLVLRAWA